MPTRSRCCLPVHLEAGSEHAVVLGTGLGVGSTAQGGWGHTRTQGGGWRGEPAGATHQHKWNKGFGSKRSPSVRGEKCSCGKGK